MVNGSIFSARIEQALGRTAQNPIALEQLKMKFADCARRVLTPDAAGAAARMIDAFENVDSVPDFTRLLQPEQLANAARARLGTLA